MALWKAGSSPSSRSLFVVVLLLVSLGTAGLLASHAHDAVTSHQTTARAVLHDYAALIADEAIRRMSVQVGYQGYFPLVTALRQALEHEDPAPSPEQFAQLENKRLRRAAGLARGFFRYRAESTRLSIAGEALDARTKRWLKEQLAQALRQDAPQEGPYGVLYGTFDGRLRSFVYALVSPAGKGHTGAAGFEVALDALPTWFHAALDRGPLVPASLGGGEVTNASLFIGLLDPTDSVHFQSGDHHWPELGVQVPFGDTYSGIFEGLQVQVSIDPAAAEKLVIGGLPASRLPLLLGLVALAAGLILAAALLLRRERALTRLRSDFVSGVSHELRTPLTQIRMFAETLLLDRVRSPGEKRRAIEIIDKEARRLTHLVENVLHFSRAERQGVQLAFEDQELVPLVRDVIDGFRPLVADGSAIIQARFDEHDAARGLRARVDGDALKQVLLNLLDNAVKYGPVGQEIRVGLDADQEHLRLWVDDEGPGVPATERQRIWGSFLRLERDRRSTVVGTGIGLSVVRELVERHGGRCRVETGERGGARFVVELPLPDDVRTLAAQPAATHPLTAR